MGARFLRTCKNPEICRGHSPFSQVTLCDCFLALQFSANDAGPEESYSIVAKRVCHALKQILLHACSCKLNAGFFCKCQIISWVFKLVVIQAFYDLIKRISAC